ncbi:hypothetical protein LGR64_12945 [Delftia sp. Lp-1]|uniref:hypothetical protein n=1 Tax=Delftia sp. Lp-1 TaxID=682863 RepID=UPI001E28442E|nr:hypothetical protein [Delftia sp. Lp-1]MCB4787184.1 hypothetical protein [Delftia sp. Lp-1]
MEDETGSSPDLYSSIGDKTKPRYFYNSAASAFLLVSPSRFELAINRLEIRSAEIDKKENTFSIIHASGVFEIMPLSPYFCILLTGFGHGPDPL